MDFKLTQIEDDCYVFMLDRTMYSREAVLNAAYKFSYKVFLKFGASDEKSVEIVMKSKEVLSKNSIEKIACEFCNEVIDQQIRLDLDARCGSIKELIYQKAFAALKDN